MTPPPVQMVAAATAIPSAEAADMTTTIVATEPPVTGINKAPPLTVEPVTAEGPQAIAVRMGFTPYTVPEAVAGQTYLSALTQSFVGRLAVLALSGLVGLAGVLGIWRYVSQRHDTSVSKGAAGRRNAHRSRRIQGLARRDRSTMAARGNDLRFGSSSLATWRVSRKSISWTRWHRTGSPMPRSSRCAWPSTCGTTRSAA